MNSGRRHRRPVSARGYAMVLQATRYANLARAALQSGEGGRQTVATEAKTIAPHLRPDESRLPGAP